MDRNVYNSEKKLADRGWKAMEQILNQELPTQRRKKPVFWFWLLGLLLLAGGIATWRHWPAAEPVAQPTQRPSTPVATLPQNDRVKRAAGSESTPKTALERHMTPVVQPSPSASPFAPGNTSAPLRVVAPRNATTSSAAVPVLAQSAPATTNSTASQETPSEIYQTVPATVAESSNSTSSANTPEPAADLLLPAPPATSTIPEPATATAPVSSPEQTASPVQVSATTNAAAEPTVDDDNTMTPPPPGAAAEPILPKRHKTWAWGATASLVLNGQFNYAGVGAGLSVDWQPLRRWGLRSGLGYQYLPLPTNERPILSLNADSYVAATGDERLKDNFGAPVSAVIDPSALPVYVSITRFHRVELPLLAFWQPFSKLRVLGGVSLGNTVYTETGKQGLTNSIVFDIADGSANSNLNKEVSQTFRNWDWQWNLGLSFRPLRHLEVGVYYQRGFSHSNTADLLANKYSDIANYYPAQPSTSAAELLQKSSASVVTGGSKMLANLTWFF
ncbi:MAG: hypothetical protein IT260_00385 [Saprospiraceae bacterium]|nr:hypothetical protein [Saprospiraceae bacterium]